MEIKDRCQNRNGDGAVLSQKAPDRNRIMDRCNRVIPNKLLYK